jgi:flagellar biosynthesis protein FlhA
LAVADAPSVIVTHLSETVESHADEILSRDDVQAMVERVKEQAPAVVRDVIPDVIALGTLQSALCGLLRERVSVANMPRIIESIADHGKASPDEYVEVVRVRLARQLRDAYAAPDGTLHVITIDPRTEDQIAAVGRENGLDTGGARRLTTRVRECLDRVQAEGLDPVLLTRSDIRRRVRDLIGASVPDVVVLSHAEVLGAERIEAVELVSSEEVAHAG